MPTLMLMRHAKSSWSDETRDDFDRPLAGRGRKATPRIGRFLAEAELMPDLVLCSAARRTRETLGLLLPDLAGECTLRLEHGLYEAEDDADLRARLQALAGDAPAPRRTLLIGHNPAMQDLALALAGDGPAEDREAMETKFPTAALAVLELPGRGWADLAPGSATLSRFVRPRDLD